MLSGKDKAMSNPLLAIAILIAAPIVATMLDWLIDGDEPAEGIGIFLLQAVFCPAVIAAHLVFDREKQDMIALGVFQILLLLGAGVWASLLLSCFWIVVIWVLFAIWSVLFVLIAIVGSCLDVDASSLKYDDGDLPLY